MEYLKILRLNHWVKNLIVFAPVFFAGKIFTAEKVLPSIYTFIAFCLASSAVYIFNDILDKNHDSKHKYKKIRPIAAGKIKVAQAAFLAAILILSAGILIYFKTQEIFWVLAAYIFLNIIYSIYLKHIVVFDILLVSAFYILRVAAGGIASATLVSNWLILCTIFISLFMIVGKRKAEFYNENRRKVLNEYNENFLDHLLTISLSLSIVSYSLYTILGSKNDMVVYSIFIILLGTFRYLYLVYSSEKSESPEKLIFSDKVILSSIMLWIGYMYFIFYT